MKKKKIILTGAAVAAVVVIGIGAWTLFGRKSSDVLTYKSKGLMIRCDPKRVL